MATAKKEIEQIEEINDELTIVAPEEKREYTGPMVDVYLPLLEDTGSNGLKVDQYEHVTIANEEKEMCWKIRRGMNVEVPVPVYCVLKETGRYPNI